MKLSGSSVMVHCLPALSVPLTEIGKVEVGRDEESTLILLLSYQLLPKLYSTLDIEECILHYTSTFAAV